MKLQEAGKTGNAISEREAVFSYTLRPSCVGFDIARVRARIWAVGGWNEEDEPHEVGS